VAFPLLFFRTFRACPFSTSAPAASAVGCICRRVAAGSKPCLPLLRTVTSCTTGPRVCAESCREMVSGYCEKGRNVN